MTKCSRITRTFLIFWTAFPRVPTIFYLKQLLVNKKSIVLNNYINFIANVNGAN